MTLTCLLTGMLRKCFKVSDCTENMYKQFDQQIQINLPTDEQGNTFRCLTILGNPVVCMENDSLPTCHRNTDHVKSCT